MTQQPFPEQPEAGGHSQPAEATSNVTPQETTGGTPTATGQTPAQGANAPEASETGDAVADSSAQPASLWQTGQATPQAPQVLADLPVVPAHVTKEIFNSALRSMLILVAVVLVVGSALGYLFAGLPGLWAALMAVGVTLIFSGTTIWSMIYTTDKSPNTTMAVVLGAWVGKMALFVVVLALLSGATFYHKLTFGIIVLLSVFASAILDMRAVVKGRMPYVQPTSS